MTTVTQQPWQDGLWIDWQPPKESAWASKDRARILVINGKCGAAAIEHGGFMVIFMGFYMVNQHNELERSMIFHGKTHYFDGRR